ncbi:MAG TPA: Uma2 family endonuclease [Ktedonobacterales bacterium]
MARNVFAPWAEIVPDVGPMTADDLLKLPDDGWRYELVYGVLVRMAPTHFEHASLVHRLDRTLGNYVDPRGLGQVLAGDPGFVLSQAGKPDLVLAPDIAFVAAARIPSTGASGSTGFPRLAPDLAIEVASPSQYKPEMNDKAKAYLDTGVRLVWVVWNDTQTVDVWRLGSDAPAATLAMGGALDGLDVIPGFSYALAELFG